ncbi:hypothetical protein HY419_00320 [candidate division WWE3 bacterium]|nr:hypothetical protein [candidate division WWE3 bacterium]
MFEFPSQLFPHDEFGILSHLKVTSFETDEALLSGFNRIAEAGAVFWHVTKFQVLESVDL